MDREIKFKRAHFFDEERTQFSHYSEWGVGIKGSTFTSPSSNNFAPYFRDYQFTGLHDKNGVEIYEGDQFAPDTDNDEVKSVVRWDETFAKFVVDIYGYDFYIGEGSQEVYDNELSICDTTDLGDMNLEYCEIIGNTHTQDGGQEG